MRQSRHDKAVKLALEAQGGMIYPGQSLDLNPYLQPPPKRRKGKFSHILNGKERTYQQIYREKNKAGFKKLSVAAYCDVLSRLEMDEREPT